MLILKPLSKKIEGCTPLRYTGNQRTKAMIENPNYNLKSIEKNRQTNALVGLKTWLGTWIAAIACVASVSVQFRSKQWGTWVKDRAKNGASKRAGTGWERKEGNAISFLPLSLPLFHFLVLVSFLAQSKQKIPFHGLFLLRNQTETLATQAIAASSDQMKMISFKTPLSKVGKKQLPDCLHVALSSPHIFHRFLVVAKH